MVTPDAGDRGRHALTCEERGQEGTVVGVGTDGARRQVGSLQVKAPGGHEYGKLSYAGTGICLSHKDRLDAVSALCTTQGSGPKP